MEFGTTQDRFIGVEKKIPQNSIVDILVDLKLGLLTF